MKNKKKGHKKKTINTMKRFLKNHKINESKAIAHRMLTNFTPKVEETPQKKKERKAKKHRHKLIES